MRPAHAGVKESQRDVHPKSDYFSAVGLSSVKTIADRYRHAAYHNKQWWRAFSGINIDDLEWLWTTKIGVFSVSCDFRLQKRELRRWVEIDQDYLRPGSAIVSRASHEH